MLDYADDIASDFSVFHRVDDVGELDADRFFRLASRLGAYSGAVTVVLRADQALAAGRPAVPAQAPVPEVRTTDNGMPDARTADGSDTPEHVIKQLQEQALAKRYGVDRSEITWVSGDEIVKELMR